MYPKGGLICSEHINPRSSTERRSTASERECPIETDARFLLAEEQKAERDFLTKLRGFLTNLKVRTTYCGLSFYQQKVTAILPLREKQVVINE